MQLYGHDDANDIEFSLQTLVQTLVCYATVSDFEIRVSDLFAGIEHSLHFSKKIFQADRFGLIAVEPFR